MDEVQQMLRNFSHDYPFKPGTKREYECPKCRDTGVLYRMGENGYEETYRCECYELRQSKEMVKRTKEMMERSGISAEFRKKSFDNFATKGNSQLFNAKKKAMMYVDNFMKTEHDRRNSIMFSGQSGAGKTHLGTAICGELMNRGVAVVYMAYRNAVTRIKQSIIDEERYGQNLGQ